MFYELREEIDKNEFPYSLPFLELIIYVCDH